MIELYLTAVCVVSALFLVVVLDEMWGDDD